MASVLVVAPHAMDEALGCGGAMALHAQKGDRVDTLILFGDGSGMDAGRCEAAPRAASILGAQAPRFVGFPENRSDTLPLVEVIGAVEFAIAELKPSTLYVTHGGNLNIDHNITFNATLTAARPVPDHPVKMLYAYEVLSSTEWAPPSAARTFLPTRFVDITTVLELKMRALESYVAEMRVAPHSRSAEGVRALARHRGYSVGIEAAEAFVLVREIAA